MRSESPEITHSEMDYNCVFTCVSRLLGTSAGEAGPVRLYQCLDGQKQAVMDTG